MQQSVIRDRILLFFTIALVAMSVPSIVSVAGASPAGTPAEDRARGLVFDDLVREEAGPCAGSYRLVGVNDRVVRCSHGPDPAPPGVDVTRPRTTAELQVGAVSQGTASASGSTVPCSGDGTSGQRVQAVYAYASDVPDRFTDVVDLIGGWAGTVDRIFADSAAVTGGVRHVRWVTDADCRLSVVKVQLSPSGDDTLTNTINELKAAGINRTDRKYLIWADASVYCGMAEMRGDDRPGATNAHEGGPHYARVDSACWGFINATEAHELMHNLGGIQRSAPNSSGAGHCTDDHDRMCYQDTFSTSVRQICAWEHERLFDCGNDDYFHTSPPSGSYLANYWNPAMSSFLDQGSAESSESGDPPSTTDTDPVVTTSTWSGTLNKKVRSVSHTVEVGAGALDAVLRFTKAKALTLTIRRSDGTVVTQKSGGSPVSLTATVPSGTYSLVVSTTSGNGSYTLTATYAGS